MANAADKDKIYCICSTPELWEKDIWDGFEMKLKSPLGGIQQAGALETAVISVTSIVVAFG